MTWHRTHLICWLTSALILLFGLFSRGQFDLVIEGTFVELELIHIWLGIALLYALYGVLCFLLFRLKKPMNSLSFWVHYTLTTLGILSIATLLYYSTQSDFTGYNDESVYYDERMYEVYTNYSGWIGKLLLVVVLVQLLFISSFVRSLVGSKTLS